MHLCYVDEAGCPGALPSPTSSVQPVLTIAALWFPQTALRAITWDFLQLKAAFNPTLAKGSPHYLDLARSEIKGSDLRKAIRDGTPTARRWAIGFLDKTLNLLETHGAKFVTRIYVKAPGGGFDGRAVYTSAMQSMCGHIQNYLASNSSQGFIIADSRNMALNSIVSHSIFTQKHRAQGDAFPLILDSPTFGHSQNHIPLQIADFLCSALLTPMATYSYCTGHVTSVHVRPEDLAIRQRYAQRVKQLAYRYSDGSRWLGGVTVHDAIQHRSASLMLRP